MSVYLNDREPVVVGAGAPSRVVIRGIGVRSAHAKLFMSGGELFVESIATAPVKVNGRPVTGKVRVASGDWVVFGESVFRLEIHHPECAEASREFKPTLENPEARQSAFGVGGGRIEADSKTITVGRLPENSICIPSPMVSRHHARIVYASRRYVIQDLQSTNGTFVNDRRIPQWSVLNQGDRIQFGSFSYIFQDGELREAEDAGSIRLEARSLRKIVRDAATRKKRALLADITFAVRPGEFVGIFGTTGSGKSTLMDALNGRRPASGGAVLYNGVNFYECFDLFKASIGYVPQQDIVHRRISVHNALAYTARLRLPEDTSQLEIEGHIRRVLERVGLADKARQRIDTPAPLSGGELKRVGLAIELVSNPSILFLDETTSGLDAGTDKRMMRLFAELARDGKTVVCVTHTLENVDTCDLVLLLHRGCLAYFGPPAGVAEYFRIKRISDVYDALERGTAENWAERYKDSSLYDRYVTQRLSENSPPTQSIAPEISRTNSSSDWLHWRQVRVLTRRYLDLIISDKRNLALLLLQAPVIGLIIGKVFNPAGPLDVRARVESQVMFILVLSAIWLGCLNSAREIVKELPIYRRERSVNLAILSYLTSKLLPLAGLCAFQCTALLLTVEQFVSIPGSFLARAVSLFATGMAAAAMGLTISAAFTTADKAIGAVPIVLIPQVILSGAIVTLNGFSETLARWSMISYWGFDCMKSTLASEVRQVVGVRSGYWIDLAVAILFFSGFLVAAAGALKLRDRRR